MPPASVRRAALALGDLPKVEAMRGDDCVCAGPISMNGSGNLELVAEKVKRERGNVYAKVTVTFNGIEAAYDTLNVDKLADRETLARRAAETVGMSDKGHVATLKQLINGFCSQVMPTWLEALSPVVAVGKDAPSTSVLIEPYLTDSRTILFAPGGSAKSWLSLIWALHLHWDLKSLWRTKHPRKVLYVDFEDTQDVFESRLHQAAALLSCPAQLPYISTEGRRLSDVWDSVQRWCRTQQTGFVFLDSISGAGFGKLIADDVANDGIDMINRLGLPWLAVAHTAKNGDGDHVFGSVMWENRARVVLRGESAQMPDDEHTVGLRLSISKANHIRRGQAQTWMWRFDDAGRLCEHRRGDEQDFPDLPASGGKGGEIEAYLAVHHSATPAQIADDLDMARPNVYRYLRGDRFIRLMDEKGKVRYGLLDTRDTAEAPK